MNKSARGFGLFFLLLLGLGVGAYNQPSIKNRLDWRLDELRAKMLSDTANLSASAAWIEGPEGAICPHCGAKLAGKGLKRRKLQVRGENEVELERKYGVCPECGQGIFPPG